MKKKIVTSVICLAVILVFNFALPRLMPGDTVLMLVGMDEGVVSADEYAFYAEKTGANKPLLQQFGEYLLGVFRGDLGYSYHHKAEVSQLILRRLPATLQLALPAVILSSLIALALGCLMGMKKGRPVENAVTGIQIALDAVPSVPAGAAVAGAVRVPAGLAADGRAEFPARAGERRTAGPHLAPHLAGRHAGSGVSTAQIPDALQHGGAAEERREIRPLCPQPRHGGWRRLPLRRSCPTSASRF